MTTRFCVICRSKEATWRFGLLSDFHVQEVCDDHKNLIQIKWKSTYGKDKYYVKRIGEEKMSIVAKFRVDRYETGLRLHNTGQKNDQGAAIHEHREIRTIILMPVYSSDPESENHKFWDATPTGEIRLGTINPEAWQQFELGKEYYVTFERAEEG